LWSNFRHITFKISNLSIELVLSNIEWPLCSIRVRNNIHFVYIFVQRYFIMREKPLINYLVVEVGLDLEFQVKKLFIWESRKITTLCTFTLSLQEVFTTLYMERFHYVERFVKRDFILRRPFNFTESFYRAKRFEQITFIVHKYISFCGEILLCRVQSTLLTTFNQLISGIKNT